MCWRIQSQQPFGFKTDTSFSRIQGTNFDSIWTPSKRLEATTFKITIDLACS